MSLISSVIEVGAQPQRETSGLPKHVAIIMDGNGRWANAKGLPRTAGHKKGADSARNVIEFCVEMGIPYLTLYAFSSENWNRPAREIDDLMGLLRYYLDHEIARFVKEGVRIVFIGSRERLAPDILERMERAEETTASNRRLNLYVALSYGGREEITRAAKKMARRIATGELTADAINEDNFASCLDTYGAPDPDLLIRTGGEERVSNFLLWQLAYAEFYFTPTLWPDFDKQAFGQAVKEFATRERRYGTTVE